VSDSSGTAWAGRKFEPTRSIGDDGSAPVALIDAIRRFRLHEVGEADVVETLRVSRLLVPLVAHRAQAEVNSAGQIVDQSAELAMVTVLGPDGRNVLPAFSSVGAMRAWDSGARPVPVAAVRVALAAASEQTDLVVLDPQSETEFVVRRPALWAIGQSRRWIPSYLDDEVRQAFTQIEDDRILAIRLAPGDPDARLAGPELIVHLTLRPGLTQSELDRLLIAVQERWAVDETIVTRVDSLGVKLVSVE